MRARPTPPRRMTRAPGCQLDRPWRREPPGCAKQREQIRYTRREALFTSVVLVRGVSTYMNTHAARSLPPRPSLLPRVDCARRYPSSPHVPPRLALGWKGGQPALAPRPSVFRAARQTPVGCPSPRRVRRRWSERRGEPAGSLASLGSGVALLVRRTRTWRI